KGEMSLMRYVEPTRVKGNALLMKDFSDKIWMFNKRTKRTRMLASSAKKQKFEGSDFSYEDMGSGDSWKEDYLPSNKGIKKINKEDCYEVELIPTLASNISYSKLVCYMRVKDVFPVRFDYYDEKGELLKMLHLENIKDIQGVLTPMVMRMENVLDKTETIMEYINIDYSVKLKESFFNERNLGR
ncbi:MAG: outer membrane lipoprotein-sorting protein, partial [Candidatus Marinimicrobia bacterium]|nr:outer membrane lipoprotein-sorting protein [Candidatus Neomarinimicrobiota bacterium]